MITTTHHKTVLENRVWACGVNRPSINLIEAATLPYPGCGVKPLTGKSVRSPLVKRLWGMTTPDLLDALIITLSRVTELAERPEAFSEEERAGTLTFAKWLKRHAIPHANRLQGRP